MPYNADEIMSKEWFLERIDELKKDYQELLNDEERLILKKRQIEIELAVLIDEFRKFLRTV